MKLEPLRSLQSKLSIAFLAAAALVLGSCGGGGATSTPTAVGALQLLPGASTFYAGVPYTLTIVGGRKPYLVTSNEETLIKLGFTIDQNEFTIVPNNPGVVNVGLDPNEVPRRTVTIQVRDSNGVSISNEYSVLQNFFTGYGESYTSTCAAGGTGAPPAACSGSETLITLIPVSQGVLYGNRELQFDRVRGDYSFVVEDPNATPQLVSTIRVRTDQVGRARVRLRTTVSAPTQMATYRVTDVATGVTTNLAFGIIQQLPADTITFLPGASWTFTGPLTTVCGSGSADFFIYGGTPPYSIQAVSPLQLSANMLAREGDRLTVTMPGTGGVCASGLGVVVTDTKGSRGQILISSVLGTGTLPALAAAPVAIASLACGTSSSVTVVGGTGLYAANSSHPRITATVAGNTVTVSRLAGDTATFPVTGVISVTDGATVVSVTVTATPANCP